MRGEYFMEKYVVRYVVWVYIQFEYPRRNRIMSQCVLVES